MKVNREIRAPKVRLIDHTGKQVGIVSTREAMSMAEEQGLDLVEVVPNASPPVCKVINYGKFRYDQTKKDKENKKAQHQVKLKEIKFKPNIDQHDFTFKVNHARQFLEKGFKVKFTCMYRGREMAHQDVGHKLFERVCEELEEIAQVEGPKKMMGRILSMVLAPGAKKKGALSRKNEKE